MFTSLLVLGTKVSARVNNVFTMIKVGIVLFVIVVGFTYFDAANLVPFVPPTVPSAGSSADVWSQSLLSWATGDAPAKYGIAGVLSGAALVFFAFIGFDVVATSAEEVKDPQKTLPRGIFGGLALVTILYLLVSLALTGMVPYTVLAEADESIAGHRLHRRRGELGGAADFGRHPDRPDHGDHGAADGTVTGAAGDEPRRPAAALAQRHLRKPQDAGAPAIDLRRGGGACWPASPGSRSSRR